MNKKTKIQTIVSLSFIIGLLGIAAVATGINTNNAKLGVAVVNTYTATLDGGATWKDLAGGTSYSANNEALHIGITAGLSNTAFVLKIGVKGLSYVTITDGTGDERRRRTPRYLF
jgi:hypothetical protein